MHVPTLSLAVRSRINKIVKNRILACFLPLLFGLPGHTYAQDSAGSKLLDSKCAACHARTDNGLERIKDSRRTPEGWDMTLVRMMLVHGVAISSDERSALVKTLADTNGLAPQETSDRRYILERRPNMVEDQPDETLTAMCARCHSYARFSIQRRSREEWHKLTHFHMGQFPTAEYQAMARDRNWWEILSTEVPDILVKYFPLETDAWTAWQATEPTDMSGEWRITGHQAGHGSYQGIMRVSGDGDDQYSIKLDIEFADGNKTSGSGNAIVYTGYEWRANLDIDGQSVLQVAALDPNSGKLSGRWFFAENDAIGADLLAMRSDAGASIMAVSPPYLKAGQATKIAVHGTGLSGDLNLGEGIEITEIITATTDTVIAMVSANADTAIGSRDLSLGETKAEGAITVYQKIDSLSVVPALAIARVGDIDGPLAPVPAQFDAIAYLNGADGEPGTEDDIRIGVMPAKWSMENINEAAAAMEDTKYAGTIDTDQGLFTPAGAGPNPARIYQTNNAGDLTVKATLDDEDNSLEGTAHLIVTVQRWNDPPIR